MNSSDCKRIGDIQPSLPRGIAGSTSSRELAIKNQYGIRTDFLRVVCGSAMAQERMVSELDHARFTWTTPYLEVRKVDDVGQGNDSGGRLSAK